MCVSAVSSPPPKTGQNATGLSLEACLAASGAVYIPAGKLILVSLACPTSWQKFELVHGLVIAEITVAAEKRAVQNQINN